MGHLSSGLCQSRWCPRQVKSWVIKQAILHGSLSRNWVSYSPSLMVICPNPVQSQCIPSLMELFSTLYVAGHQIFSDGEGKAEACSQSEINLSEVRIRWSQALLQSTECPLACSQLSSCVSICSSNSKLLDSQRMYLKRGGEACDLLMHKWGDGQEEQKLQLGSKSSRYHVSWNSENFSFLCSQRWHRIWFPHCPPQPPTRQESETPIAFTIFYSYIHFWFLLLVLLLFAFYTY